LATDKKSYFVFKINILDMKNIFLICLCLFIGYTGFSQSDYRQKTLQLIELSNKPTFEVMMQQVIDMVPEEKRPAFKKDIDETLPELYEQLVEVYMETYTEADVDEMLAFYSSPTGKKMLAETPGLTLKAMEIGQGWGARLQPIIMKYLQQ
jgi:hypothetical protein